MKVTQYCRVLRHLQENGKITSWEAFTDYGITRLSAVIHILRKDGFRIKTDYKTSLNRYGESVTFGEYSWDWQ